MLLTPERNVCPSYRQRVASERVMEPGPKHGHSGRARVFACSGGAESHVSLRPCPSHAGEFHDLLLAGAHVVVAKATNRQGYSVFSENLANNSLQMQTNLLPVDEGRWWMQ